MKREEYKTRPSVLVVAGYDQSAGAGILSDVKTLEAHNVYGYAVCTAFTFQNERTISQVDWFSEKAIFEQIDLCYADLHFEWVKMGITQSMTQALRIIGHLRQHRPDVKIVLDPVIRSTEGTEFWSLEKGRKDWEELAAACYLLTPNWEEIGWLYPEEEVEDCCSMLTSDGKTNVYLKGGHHPEIPGRDYLWSAGDVSELNAEDDENPVYPKHGSGCVLSSSLTANLALGYSLPISAVRSKRYIHRFLTSNKTLLGWHQ